MLTKTGRAAAAWEERGEWEAAARRLPNAVRANASFNARMTPPRNYQHTRSLRPRRPLTYLPNAFDMRAAYIGRYADAAERQFVWKA